MNGVSGTASPTATPLAPESEEISDPSADNTPLSAHSAADTAPTPSLPMSSASSSSFAPDLYGSLSEFSPSSSVPPSTSASPTQSASEYEPLAQFSSIPSAPHVGEPVKHIRGPPGANLLVYNLPEPIDRDQLRALFAPFGTLLSATPVDIVNQFPV